MRIKKLEICGFKSFADRARLHFGDGVTGVVGPNGCGKSNVVDAIRWVMGEMSAKHLRGRGMQDVIFAGATGRAPLGMAEVTLTFDNDGNVPPAYLSYTEIAVTRRLFRDGTSEYLINKSPVRLRDITDLFLGTGVGTRAYSIIEQGRIAFVVNSRPEERRSLIEEVAGITKFKVRKKAAERRIESTQQNLARVGDVVAELDRQLVTLRKQAKKAEAYRDLKAKLREHELHAAVAELLRLNVTRAANDAEVERLDDAIGDRSRSAEAEESALEARRLALLAQEQTLAALQEASATQAGRLGGLQRDLAHWQEQARSAKASEERAAHDAVEAEEHLAANAEEAQRLATALAEHEAGSDQDTGEVDGASMQVDEAQQALAAVDDELSVARREAMAQVQGAVQHQAALDAVQRQRHDREVEQQRRQEEADRLTPEAAAAVVRQEELERDGAEAVARLEAVREAQQKAQEQLPVAREARAHAQRAARAAADALAGRASRLTSLQQIVQRLEGYGDGVRRLYGNAGERLQGVVALVAEVLEVPPAHERAVEAALGERLQYLVVDDAGVAERGIEALVAGGGGRSGFVPEMLPGPDAATADAWPRGEGVLGLAAELVRCAPEHRGLAHALLGRTVLVRDLATAQAQAQAQQAAGGAGPWRWVTAAGETVEPGPIVAGGAADDAGLLATRREVRELQDEVAACTAARDDADAAQAAAEQQLATLEVTLSQLGREVHGIEMAALEGRKNLEAVRHARARHETRLQDLQAQLGQFGEELEALVVREAELHAAAQAAEAGRDEGTWRLEELEERRQVYAGQLAEHQEALMALKVRQAQAQERGRSLAQARARLEQAAPALQARIARAREVALEVGRTLQELTGRQAKGEADMDGFVADAERARAAHESARQSYAAAQEALLADEQAIKAARRGAFELQESLTQGRMQQQKLELAQNNLVAQVRERYDLELVEAVEDYHDRPLPGSDARRARGDMERELRQMGAINLTAIEECAEVEGRFTFLQAQQEDLEQALHTLQEAILRINKTSRERFQQAFDAVNQTFQQVYPRLFHGGSARLELIAADDLLECGVDIIAMPPGKKLQSVNLLSGGEKALTATALVFAIFLIKPSPFCILDEVDAPLDEANVGRFNEMLREISKVSQFIVITHNKQTMLQMDRLYGITMEDAGMSKVVAVDLHNRRDEQAA